MTTGVDDDRARRKDDFWGGGGGEIASLAGAGKGEGGKGNNLRQGYHIIHTKSWRVSRLNMGLPRRCPPSVVTT